MARIFIANEPSGAEVLERLLGGEHELTIVNRLHPAISLLEQQDFDLIVIGVHFDESAMFDLIFACKQIPRVTHTPIICFCSRNTALTRLMHESIEAATTTLGAWMYLDQHDYNVKKNPDAELKRVIERCLVSSERARLHERRAKIQKRRQELLELRQGLEDKEWSADLEDRVAELRQKLSEVLLELSHVQINEYAQHEKLAASKDLDDRVSLKVKKSENIMARTERLQSLEEGRQLGKEQEIIPKEEAKGKEGRRKTTDAEGTEKPE